MVVNAFNICLHSTLLFVPICSSIPLVIISLSLSLLVGNLQHQTQYKRTEQPLAIYISLTSSVIHSFKSLVKMGLYFHCIHAPRHIHLLLSVLLLLLLLLLSSTQLRCSAEGRAVARLVEIAKEGGGGGMVMERATIGSRPPRCETRCSSCGHCEAVEVPVVPQANHLFTTITSRGDYNSNYKPVNWKCKCGDMMFSP